MSGKWITRAQSKSATRDNLSDIADEPVVLLIQGKNLFGDRIYTYIKMTVVKMKELKATMDSGKDFSPSDYGEIVASGKGEPSDEIKAEMATTYNMIPIPQAPARPIPAMPKFWGDEGEDWGST